MYPLYKVLLNYVLDLEILLAETEDSVMTLSNMLTSPHVAEFGPEVEHWVHLLQELGNMNNTEYEWWEYCHIHTFINIYL